MVKKKLLPTILPANEYLTDDIKIKVSARTVDFQFPAHGHEFFEIEFVTDGFADYTVNGKEFSLEKGSLYFVTPADIHSVRSYEHPVTVYNVQFDEKSIDTSLMMRLLELDNMNCYKLTEAMYDSVYSIFDLLLKEYRGRSKFRNICLKNYLENLIVSVLRRFKNKDFIKNNDNSLVNNAIIYIHNNFREGITLKEVADVIGFNQCYLSKAFHDLTGVTFKSYVDRLRLSYAETLLKTTNLSITEVCYASGFKNVSNFIRRFTEVKNISPAKFRIKEDEIVVE